MIHPSRLECDFCAQEVKRGERAVALDVPLSRAVQNECTALWRAEEDAAKRSVTSPLSSMFSFSFGPPTGVKLHICEGCLYGFLPEFREKVRAAVRRYFEEQSAARQRREENDVFDGA